MFTSILSTQCLRHFSAQSTAGKEVIKSLRADTGLPFVRIKEALLATDNDPAKAKQWLLQKAEEQNWSKAQKLSTRETNQGLVGVISEPTSISLGSVLCETDFVASNKEFVKFLYQSIAELPKLGGSGLIEGSKIINNKDLNSLLIKSIGGLGENIQPHRYYHHNLLKGQTFGTYVHGKLDSPFDNFQAGKIASAVIFHNLSDVYLQNCIAQHIVGTLPCDTPLLQQEFLHDDSLIIQDLCNQHSFEIVDFCRLSF